jgi:hypothetical protein
MASYPASDEKQSQFAQPSSEKGATEAQTYDLEEPNRKDIGHESGALHRSMKSRHIQVSLLPTFSVQPRAKRKKEKKKNSTKITVVVHAPHFAR